MARSAADSFRAFLEEKQRLESNAPAANLAATAGGTPLSLLFKLAEAPNFQMKLSDLQAASGMSFGVFAETVKSLGESGYVVVSGAAGGEVLRWTRVGVAGTGAMALFRASLFNVHAGDHDIAIGPSSFLQVFRDAADRAVDRLRAQARSAGVARLMEGLDYSKAFDGLPPYCLALMQNVSDEDQKTMLQALALLDQDTFDPTIKVRILGLHLMNVVGPAVVKAAVESLRMELAEEKKTGAGGAGGAPAKTHCRVL